MGYIWWLVLAVTLSADTGLVHSKAQFHVNFTTVLIETVRNFQLRGRLFALHVSYIVLGFLSVLLMFGLSIVLLSGHQWCKKKEEEDAKTMELVPHDIFEVHYPDT